MAKEINKMLSDFAFVIEAFDGYRVGRNANPKRVDAKIRQWHEIEGSLPRKWLSLQRDIDTLINLTLRDPDAKKFANIYVLIKFGLRIVYLLLLSSFLILLRWPDSGMLLIYASLGMLYFLLILRWYTLDKMFMYYEKVISNQRGKVEQLKLAVNSLIKNLIEHLKREKISPKKYRLHLFNTDYDGIKVLKKPGWLRDYYLCEVVIGD
ncbi:MAG: hypothetical protein ACP5GU_09500 [Thermoprotei archaeon]|jgi:hypothetical protein